MLAGEDLLAGVFRHAENLIHLLYAGETLARGFDRKDRIAITAFREERPGRDQARDIIALGIIQNARNVIIDAMRDAHDAVAKRIQISADEGRLNADIERG